MVEKVDPEMAEFEAALLRSAQQAASGQYARIHTAGLTHDVDFWEAHSSLQDGALVARPVRQGDSPMALQLYYHPFSAYCQKALIALYDNGIEFERNVLDGPDSPAGKRLAELWPMKRFPVLVDGERTVIEATCIIEYLGLYHPGPVRMIPEDPKAALETRFMDRFFDNYVAAPMMQIVFNHLRPEETRDAHGVTQSRGMLDTSYAWLDQKMARREWAAGDRFSLADCGAAPFLFYADWTHRIPQQYGNVHAYRRRLLQYPPFARAVEDARPLRHLFPLGAPDRD